MQSQIYYSCLFEGAGYQPPPSFLYLEIKYENFKHYPLKMFKPPSTLLPFEKTFIFYKSEIFRSISPSKYLIKMILSLLAACVSSKRTFYKIVTDKNYKLAIILMNFTKSAAEYFQNNNKQLTAD